MMKTSEEAGKQWVSLGHACKILEVNETTARRWADRGLVRSYRTPGGHRRFSMDDLRAMIQGPATASVPEHERGVAEATLQRIRRGLRSRSANQQAWYDQIREESRQRMRMFGYRLLTLATDYLAGGRHRTELLAEATSVGEEYGTETARMGLPLSQALTAFTFFRNSLVEGLQKSTNADNTPDGIYRRWQQVNAITDAVLKGIVQAYQGGDTSSPDASTYEAAAFQVSDTPV